MKTFNVPYAKGFVEINIPNQNIAGVLESKAHSYKAELSQEALVEHALDNPIGSQRLEELVKGKSNMVIITSDHTRPVPSKITMPILLRRIREANPSIDITILLCWMDGPGGREKVGLPGNRGPQMVVTDLGIMKFDEETKRMYLAYYYPFSSPEMVQENTGFEVDVSRAQLFEGPSPEIIRVIREEIDPGQAFIKVPKE